MCFFVCIFSSSFVSDTLVSSSFVLFEFFFHYPQILHQILFPSPSLSAHDRILVCVFTQSVSQKITKDAVLVFHLFQNKKIMNSYSDNAVQ